MTRLPRRAWLEIGLGLLAESGPESVTIDAVSARAGRSKGSFYHHFGGIEGYLLALVEFWRDRDTEDVIRASSEAAEAGGRLALLNRLTSRLDHGVETAIRRLCATRPALGALCLAVDKRRIGYLVKLHRETGLFAPEEAELLAQVTYAAFVGFQTIAPDMPPDIAEDAYFRFMRLVTRGRG